jgi:hypothetical protein
MHGGTHKIGGVYTIGQLKVSQWYIASEFCNTVISLKLLCISQLHRIVGATYTWVLAETHFLTAVCMVLFVSHRYPPYVKCNGVKFPVINFEIPVFTGNFPVFEKKPPLLDLRFPFSAMRGSFATQFSPFLPP